MSDLASHVAQANHNESCAQFLLVEQKSKFRDWAITAAFYAAVHLAEASFAYRNEDSGSHTERNNKLLKSVPNATYITYRKLYNASRNVRYLTNTKTGMKATDYFSLKDVEGFVLTDVPALRNEFEKAFGVKLS